MSELAKNLSTTALMLVVETLAAKELYDINRTTENFEFLCEKRGKLETYIDELEAERRWIPVSERLPEVGEMVLIAYKISRKTYIARARMNKEGMFRFTKNTKPVTHWMPLPNPPEAH
jgi:hypothetical protein